MPHYLIEPDCTVISHASEDVIEHTSHCFLLASCSLSRDEFQITMITTSKVQRTRELPSRTSI